MPSMLVGGIMRYFKRESYLEKIRGFYPDDGMIKVITGVRRCGKSCLMRTIEEELREGGVLAERIAFFDLDRYGFRSVKTADQLERLIEPMLEVEGLKYLFIDEVQNVKGFEEVVNELRAEGGSRSRTSRSSPSCATMSSTTSAQRLDFGARDA